MVAVVLRIVVVLSLLAPAAARAATARFDDSPRHFSLVVQADELCDLTSEEGKGCRDDDRARRSRLKATEDPKKLLVGTVRARAGDLGVTIDVFRGPPIKTRLGGSPEALAAFKAGMTDNGLDVIDGPRRVDFGPVAALRFAAHPSAEELLIGYAVSARDAVYHVGFKAERSKRAALEGFAQSTMASMVTSPAALGPASNGVDPGLRDAYEAGGIAASILFYGLAGVVGIVIFVLYARKKRRSE
jgi:hypothetical protein